VVLTDLIVLRALGYFDDQQEFELSQGISSEGEQEFAMQPVQINNPLGAWGDVTEIPNWPMGCIIVMSAFDNGDWGRMGETMLHILNVAKAVLRTRAGVTAYLKGEPLFQDTARLNLPAGTGPENADGDWMFPCLQFPYLTHVLGLQDIDLCGPDLEYNLNEGAKSALQWVDAIRCELEDGGKSPWNRRTLAERNEHTAPIAPKLVSPASWRRNTKQKQISRTAPDAPEDEAKGAMETEEAAATADPMSPGAGASSAGSPIGGFARPTEKMKGVQLPAAASADDDDAMDRSPVVVKLESVEDQLFSIRMREHELELQRVAKQEPIAVENNPVASDEEGDETAPVNSELADRNENIEEDKLNCRSEADAILRTALDVRKKSFRNVGVAPELKVMRPWEPLGNLDHCARSWIARVEQMGTSHVARRHSHLKIKITDDAALTLNTLAALDVLNAQTPSGMFSTHRRCPDGLCV
jgi:hypothetical protein